MTKAWIWPVVFSLIGATASVRAADGCDRTLQPQTPRCEAAFERVGRLAVAVGLSMDAAEVAAREGWLEPGEGRAERSRHGMDDGFWDELVRMVQTYR